MKKKINKIFWYFSQNFGRELAVNVLVFILLIRDRGCVIKIGFFEFFKFYFKQKVKDNRISSQCVYWKISFYKVCNYIDSGIDYRFVFCFYEENLVLICRFQKFVNLVFNQGIDNYFNQYERMNDMFDVYICCGLKFIWNF